MRTDCWCGGSDAAFFRNLRSSVHYLLVWVKKSRRHVAQKLDDIINNNNNRKKKTGKILREITTRLEGAFKPPGGGRRTATAPAFISVCQSAPPSCPAPLPPQSPSVSLSLTLIQSLPSHLSPLPPPPLSFHPPTSTLPPPQPVYSH